MRLLIGLLAVLAIAAAVTCLVLLVPRPRPVVATSPAWPAVVTTLAGDGTPALRDGPAWTAQFAEPFGIAVNADGDAYISDAADNNRIRFLSRHGWVATIAGGNEGFLDGRGSSAAFNTPSGIALEAAGALLVADTGNHAIRRVTADGTVSTVAGTGAPGFADGPATEAQFDGPIGIATDRAGRVWVADTYNDRVRVIDAGSVYTAAGTGVAGFRDGPASEAQFDTPSAIAVAPNGDVYVADTGNDVIRRISNGDVSTITVWLWPGHGGDLGLVRPAALAITHDGFLYATDRRGRVVQIATDGITPAGTPAPLGGTPAPPAETTGPLAGTPTPPAGTVRRPASIVAGGGAGSADGQGGEAKFNWPVGVAVDARGDLLVADAGNALIRRVSHVDDTSPAGVLSWLSGGGTTPIFAAAPVPAPAAVERGFPRLSAAALRMPLVPWPLDPQLAWHEVAGTLGEPRGSVGGDGRERFHAGLDIRGDEGVIVRAVRDEKVSAPLAVWGPGSLSETLAVGAVTYVHIRVGRDRRNAPLDTDRFAISLNEAGAPERVRVRRGTRFKVGDAVGTVNAFYHVHLEVGPRGSEVNVLTLPLAGFFDAVPPTVVAGGVGFFRETGEPFLDKERGRTLVSGRVRIVADAYDQADGNVERRRLGLFEAGYQALDAMGNPAPGFEAPRITLRFDRLPPDPMAPRLVFAEGSGITTYGNRVTQFLYVVTNIMRDGRAATDFWDTSLLTPGDYTLRIIARDASGNEATQNTDIPVVVR